ncbi:MAG TPA: hypothetical protein PLR99_08935 [Polyangiaceae bacterium]|nr:hypothetical protein [Polyangiaceae bacterium]
MSPRAPGLRAAAAALVCAAGLSACNALIGTRDLTFGEPRDATPDTNVVVDPPDADVPDGPTDDAAADVSTDSPADGPCSADLTMDAKNCGRCGHDCLGGACAAGVCKSRVLFPSQAKPLGITLLNGVLYWTNSGTNELRRGLTDGTGEARFAKASFNQPWGIANDGVDVYFSAARDPGGVFKCPAADCQVGLRQLTSTVSQDVAVKDGVAYFTAYQSNTLSRVTTSGSSETPIATISAPFHLAIDATHAYVTSNSFYIVRVPLFGGTPFDFGANTGDTAGDVFVDDTRVYWHYGQSGAAGSVFSQAKTGGPPTQYGNSARYPLGIVADSERVYWVTLGDSEVEGDRVDGKLLTCPIAGCSVPTVLIDDLRNGAALTQDERALYVAEIGANGPGAIRKIAKP